MRTRVQKWGNSLALRIPKSFAAETRLEPDAAVDVTLVHGNLVVSPLPAPEFTLEGLLAGVTADNRYGEAETDPAVGREAWSGEMAENSLPLLAAVSEALADAGVKTWLFGGWAEELGGLRPPGPHRDIDLLFPAPDFEPLDEFLRAGGVAEEVRPKRFPHKRAFRWRGVLVEVFLVRPEAAGPVTDFFDTHRFQWPPDTLAHTVRLLGRDWPIASPSALRLFRERHGAVEEAYRRHATGRE